MRWINQPGSKSLLFVVIVLITVIAAGVTVIGYIAMVDSKRESDCEKRGGSFVNVSGNNDYCVDETDKMIKQYGN